ncbi:MAG: hypothetical protein ACR2H1_02955, partial [Limisphaerales bacterium]
YPSVPPAPLPFTLADTGAFADLTTLTPQPGIVPYDINVPFWSDNATKRRWFSLPDTNLKFTFNRDGNWDFPASSVWIKHFDLEMIKGNPQSSKRIETRFIVRNTNGVYGVTYRWGDSTSNAVLVPEGGLDETFQINDGGVTRAQVWRYPSRNECLSCHTAIGGRALGFNTRQLNCNYNYGSGPENQIQAYSDAGYFTTPVTNSLILPALARASETSVSREYRVRSYFAANCVQCHQPGGVTGANWDARATTPLPQCGIVNGILFSDGGNSNNRVVKPGSPSESMLLTRIANLGTLHMPPLATTVLNTEAINLVQDWIVNDLPSYKTFTEWQILNFGSTNSSNAVAEADPDGDNTSNYLEYLLDRNPLNPADGWKMSISVSDNSAAISFFQKANRIFELQSAANLNPPILWTPLNVSENRPFLSATDRTYVIHESMTGSSNKFYRMKVSEP